MIIIEVAAGIVLGFLILVFLPYILFGAVWLAVHAVLLAAYLAGGAALVFGVYLLANTSDAELSSLCIALVAIGSTILIGLWVWALRGEKP